MRAGAAMFPASRESRRRRFYALAVERRTYLEHDELRLLEWAKEGDGRAFEALIAPYRRMVHVVCFRITGSDHDAEDAVQNALLDAWRHLARFEHRSSFSTWLWRICHNASLATLRKRVPEPVGDGLEALAPTASSSSSIEHQYAEDDSVRWALARIPPDFRAALVLREYCDMTYAEIAEAQGIKVETVKTRISRARQAMARLLAA